MTMHMATVVGMPITQVITAYQTRPFTAVVNIGRKTKGITHGATKDINLSTYARATTTRVRPS